MSRQDTDRVVAFLDLIRVRARGGDWSRRLRLAWWQAWAIRALLPLIGLQGLVGMFGRMRCWDVAAALALAGVSGPTARLDDEIWVSYRVFTAIERMLHVDAELRGLVTVDRGRPRATHVASGSVIEVLR